MKKINKLLLTAFTASGLLFGCKKMDVANENNPDFAVVYKTGADVESVASAMYNTIFSGEHSTSGVEAMLATGADNVTCSFGNFGMRDMSYEPRDFAWNNSPAYGNAGQLKYSYDRWYAAIITASNVLKALNGGVVIGGSGDARAKAFAKFVLGLAYGNMALLYDKVHVADDTKTPEKSLASATPYKEVAAAAIGYLEEALALTDGSFSVPASWLGTPATVSGPDFKKIINTSAARILSYLPRNKTELADVDWAKVKTYADNGITSSWLIQMDGTSKWRMSAGYNLTTPGWGRTDMRVVHMMEPSLPEHWEDSPTFPHPAEPTTPPLDARLKTDFQYMGSNDFIASRGYYHFTCYRNKRYDAVYTNSIGPKATVMLAENELLRAEARAYTGDLSGAADIINAGTRVTRGNLAPVAADLTAIVKALHHERNVELYTTGCGIQFFEMRKLDLLQKGTPLHFPIPGATLQLFGETTFYTFGTVAKADGIGTSNGGWR